MIGLAVSDRLRSQVGIDPFPILAPVVADTMLLAKRLADKSPPLLVDRKGHWVGHVGTGGEEFHPKVGRDGEARRRLLRRDDVIRTNRGGLLLAWHRPGNPEPHQEQARKTVGGGDKPGKPLVMHHIKRLPRPEQARQRLGKSLNKPVLTNPPGQLSRGRGSLAAAERLPTHGG